MSRKLRATGIRRQRGPRVPGSNPEGRMNDLGGIAEIGGLECQFLSGLPLVRMLSMRAWVFS
jgi:hypothetical protein